MHFSFPLSRVSRIWYLSDTALGCQQLKHRTGSGSNFIIIISTGGSTSSKASQRPAERICNEIGKEECVGKIMKNYL